MNVLVLHGPNLNLLGERPGDEPGRTLEELNRSLKQWAQSLGVALKVSQSNHEGALLDTLHAERRWAEAVVINPGALAHTSYALRDGLAAVQKPVVEVHLSDLSKRESWRRKSLLKDVCVAQVMGQGFDSYRLALEKVAPRRTAPAPRGATRSSLPVKTLGRKPENGRGEGAQSRVSEKTVGRPTRVPAGTAGLLTRALIRQKISDRLAGKLTAGGLATWARSQWLEVQRGAPAESGHRELLEDSLQSLVISTTPASKLTDDQLIELMTQLDG